MKRIKKALFLFLVLFFSGLALSRPLLAQEGKVTVHLFWAQGCPHCEKEKAFLTQLAHEYTQVEIRDYEVSANRANSILLESVGKALGVEVAGVPFTVVGQEHFVGYLSDETTGKKIEEAVNCALENGCEDVVRGLLTKDDQSEQGQVKGASDTLTVPIFGQLNLKTLSLPVLTFIIALLDGFNPCAMWVLVFLISLLLGMKDRKRMWLLGSAFLLTSGLVYFLFLSAWLNLFLFLGWVVWVRAVVGLVALGAGGYYLYDFATNPQGACRVSSDPKKKNVFEKLRQITQKKELFLALLGIVLLALAVNLVELVCSAGLPAVYTQVLALAKLPSWQYYLYLLFYILIFMLDDLVVFITAMVTLKLTGLQGKYTRLTRLAGGIIMLAIGFLLIFKPEVLMWG